MKAMGAMALPLGALFPWAGPIQDPVLTGRATSLEKPLSSQHILSGCTYEAYVNLPRTPITLPP